jgi:hypothetical protein
VNSHLRIVVTGLIAQHPRLGGVTWDYLQYPLGLSLLGHDVYYLEDSGEWPYNADGGPAQDDWVAFDCTENVEHLAAVMSRFGLGERWAYRFPIEPRWYGLSERRRTAILESADLIVNVSGTLEHPEDYRQVPRMIYIDSDPVFTQVKLNAPETAETFRRRVDVHDVHFSFGEAFSERVPSTGHRWQPTRQPVVLTEWKQIVPPARDALTTVMSWTSYKPLRYRGETYAQKDVELTRILELPKLVKDTELEIALAPTHHVDWEVARPASSPDLAESFDDEAEVGPADLLTRAGWRVVDAGKVCSDLDSYRGYIQTSKGELGVAKHGYVIGKPGWFSCRSACYLAAGRPVIAQDTGFGAALPVGDGLLSFETLDDAAAAVAELEHNYEAHARAARELAEEYFDSYAVLTGLLERSFRAEPSTTGA